MKNNKNHLIKLIRKSEIMVQKKKTATKKQVGATMITQELKSAYWDSDKWQNVENMTDKEILDHTIDLIEENSQSDESRAVVYGVAKIHDKDPLPNGDLKVRHIHIWLKFTKKLYLTSIAKWVGIEPQYVEAPKSGRYSEENSLAYIIHANDSKKYPYQPEDVATYDFDYVKYEQEHHDKWEKSKSSMKRKKLVYDTDYYLQKVLNGELSIKEMILDNDMAVIYAENKKKFDNYFSVYGSRKAYETIDLLDNGEIALQSYYITGKPGHGKTHFAKEVMNRIKANVKATTGMDWRIFEAASTHPMDNYAGEEIIFLDDLRVSSMSASDWLKLLDPKSGATLSARYENRRKASRVIIITSYLDIHNFFYFAKGNAGNTEALDQYLRRIEAVIEVVDFDKFNYQRLVEYPISQYYEIKTSNPFNSPSLYLDYGHEVSAGTNNMPLEDVTDVIIKNVEKKSIADSEKKLLSGSVISDDDEE